MKVSERLSTAFGEAFQQQLAAFALKKKWIQKEEDLSSKRFLKRSLAPHVLTLSRLFNRQEEQGEASLWESYWSKKSSLRWAYFLGFMPPSVFRVAAVWDELARLGLEPLSWFSSSFRGIEWGAGPASGACGIAAGSFYSPLKLPDRGSWALIDQDRTMVEWGTEWAYHYFQFLEKQAWTTRSFVRRLNFKEALLPERAPSFHLWVLSYCLNEIPSFDAALVARVFLKEMQAHLEKDGLIILVEPALKLQSRKLLAWRQALLDEMKRQRIRDFKILTPCLGHQQCGALSVAEDWCHEEVSWWRPPYFRTLDELVLLDRKSLPFSYLVLIRSEKPLSVLFSQCTEAKKLSRLVSPSHKVGGHWEAYICDQYGKRRLRYRPQSLEKNQETLGRGDLLRDWDFEAKSQYVWGKKADATE